jgi:hypothetical protein
MLTEAWIGRDERGKEENEKNYQDGQTDIHGSNLSLTNPYMFLWLLIFSLYFYVTILGSHFFPVRA